MKPNLEMLNEDLKYLGFGENTLLNQQLEERIAKGEPEFDLYTDAFYEHFVRTEAKLHFFKHIGMGAYLLKYFAAENQYEQGPRKNRSREFHIYKGKGVTFKQAYNLLDGRAAKIDQRDQDDERYRVWVQLDFDELDVHDNYRFKYYHRFDLEKVLAGYPIGELQDETTRMTLLASLERGNKHLVTLHTSKPEPKWIEANPAEKTIRLSAPEPASKKHGSDGRRQSARRNMRTTSEPAAETKADEQELPEETAAVSGK